MSAKFHMATASLVFAAASCAGDPKPLPAPSPEPVGEKQPPAPAIDAAPAPPPAFDLALDQETPAGHVVAKLSAVSGETARIEVGRASDDGSLPLDFELAAGASGWNDGVLLEVVELSEGAARVRIAIADRARKEPTRVKLQKDKPHALPGGWTLTFREHSHKRVAAGGPKSPLITYVEYQGPEGDPVEESYYLHPPEEASWRFRNYRFDQQNHSYGSWIDVAITEYEVEYQK